MAEATPTGETGKPATPKTEATPTVPAVTPVKTEDTNAVEELRKKLEQQEMRNNQLANQLKEKDAADAAAKAKELEEQNQFKELYEQEKAKREAIETDVEKANRQAELEKAKQTVLKDFPDEVKEIAEEAGMDLKDTDEATITAFKEKLTNIGKRTNAKVGPNNPNTSNSGEELKGDALRSALKNDKQFHDLVTERFPTIKSMTKQG